MGRGSSKVSFSANSGAGGVSISAINKMSDDQKVEFLNSRREGTAVAVNGDIYTAAYDGKYMKWKRDKNGKYDTDYEKIITEELVKKGKIDAVLLAEWNSNEEWDKATGRK